MNRTIVVGYDGSEPSRAALAYATRELDGGRLFVVCASEPVAGYLGRPYFQRALDASIRSARECAADAAEQIPPGTDFEIEVIEGTPAEALAAVAETRGAAEIVIGSRGFGAVRGSIGSTSHDLIGRAGRPVVVIPAAAVPSVAGELVEAS